MEDFVLGVKVEQMPNQDARYYHTRKKIYNGIYWTEYEPMDNFTIMGTNLINALLNIEGIKEVHVAPYEIRVSKSPAFEWHELDREMKSAFATYHQVVYKTPGPLSGAAPGG